MSPWKGKDSSPAGGNAKGAEPEEARRPASRWAGPWLGASGATAEGERRGSNRLERATLWPESSCCLQELLPPCRGVLGDQTLPRSKQLQKERRVGEKKRKKETRLRTRCACLCAPHLWEAALAGEGPSRSDPVPSFRSLKAAPLELPQQPV